MGLIEKLRAYGGLVARPRARGVTELPGLLRRRPLLGVAVGAYEVATLASNRVDARLKTLAALKTAALIGCPF